MVGICTLFVAARFAVRAWRRTWSFLISDIFLVFAVLCFALLATGDIIINLGTGSLSDPTSVEYAKVRFIQHSTLYTVINLFWDLLVELLGSNRFSPGLLPASV